MQHISQETTSPDETSPVLIVGGSLVGLSTALFLSRFGIPVLLVERHEGTPRPRAGGYTARTMELFRMAGIEEALRKIEHPTMRGVGALHAESLAGKELGWITDEIFEEGEGSTLSFSPPVRRCEIAQMEVELVLQTHARANGADLRFTTELLTFSQDTEGITAVIRDRKSSEERTVRARYLVAADGGESGIRQQLGIAMQGPGAFAHRIGLVFDADLQQALRGRHLLICYVDNSQVRGPLVLTPFIRVLYTAYHPERGEREQDFLGTHGSDLVRAAIGIPDMAVNITDVRPWEVRAHVALHFQQDRVFLVGDAAHVMPPARGLGGNTGIADAYNLAWKLALVLQGKADPGLLSTYEAERQPVVHATMEQVLSCYLTYWDDQPLEGWPPVPMLNFPTTALGYRYHSAAIFSMPEDHEQYEDPRYPTGCPGSHAAHLLLEREGKPCSTFDLFGRGFVLLTGSDGQAWCEAARQVAAQSGVVLDAYRIGKRCKYHDVEGRFRETYGVTTSGAVLVRPDGFIAWRSETLASSPSSLLEETLFFLVGRTSSV